MGRSTKKHLLAVALLCLCLALSACGASSGSQAQQEVKHMSQEEEEMGYFYFEGIFPPNDEVRAAFEVVSDEYPRYEVVPDSYHVTTEFQPEVTHEDLYGTEVTVHITGYKYGTVVDESDGSTSLNEGFKVEVSSTDPKLQELLDSIDKNWHITGSYTTAARYTKYMDFSDAEPLDITLTGVFGGCDSNGELTLEPAAAQ